MIDLKKYAYEIQEKRLNPHTEKSIDDNGMPHFQFDGYEPEMEINLANSIQQSILARVIDAQEEVCVNAIKMWAKEKGYDDVLLMNEEKLKDIILLGSAEYERLYGGDK